MTQPLTDAINALTRYANETTGASDTTLSDAVETLVEGYGQGGGGSVSQDAEGYIVLPVDGGGGSMPHFLEPSEQIGTLTVDESNTLAVGEALSGVASTTLVIGFCPTASLYKVLLLFKRANNKVSVATGFTTGGYGNTAWNAWTWTDSNLGVGDVYYLFTGNNF